MKMISDNIGWDGQHFFCRRCGKSGYSKMAQVKGHLAMCPGTAISKGALLKPAETSQPVAASCSPVTSAFSGGSSDVSSYQQQQQLVDRVGRLENEYNHMLISQNEPVSDWLSQNKDLLVLGLVVAFIVYMIVQQSKCVCDGSSGSSGRSGKAGLGNLGEKAFTKLADRVISKSVDSIFK